MPTALPPADARRRTLTPWVAASLALIAVSFAVNPVILFLVLPAETFVAFMTWTYGLWPYGWDLLAVVLLPLLVVAWIVLLSMAFSRAGKKALWLLVEAPVLLVPAFAANALILGCYLLKQCP